MKPEERIAEKHLEGLGIGQVEFEPDGNIPPDFAVGGSTGVEVRRLNQHFFGENNTKGLEELAIPLWQVLEQEIQKLDNRFSGESYLVTMEYRRPALGPARKIRFSIRSALEEFLRRGGKAPERLILSKNLRLAVNPTSPKSGRVFLLLGGYDLDAGGGLVEMYVDNISHCIEEKSHKIEPYQNRYLAWWLILVDSMGWGIDEFDEMEIRSRILDLGRFDRVHVINGRGGKALLDLGRNSEKPSVEPKP